MEPLIATPARVGRALALGSYLGERRGCEGGASWKPARPWSHGGRPQHPVALPVWSRHAARSDTCVWGAQRERGHLEVREEATARKNPPHPHTSVRPFVPFTQGKRNSGVSCMSNRAYAPSSKGAGSRCYMHSLPVQVRQGDPLEVPGDAQGQEHPAVGVGRALRSGQRAPPQAGRQRGRAPSGGGAGSSGGGEAETEAGRDAVVELRPRGCFGRTSAT